MLLALAVSVLLKMRIHNKSCSPLRRKTERNAMRRKKTEEEMMIERKEGMNQETNEETEMKDQIDIKTGELKIQKH